MATIPTSITPLWSVPGLLTHIFEVNIFGGSMVATVTSNHMEFEEWINKVLTYRCNFPRHIGFEIELDSAHARIGTLQFCFGNQCLVFRFMQGVWPYRPDPPPRLNEFLNDRNNVFVGTEMILKIHWLSQQFGTTEWVQCEDLDYYAPELRHAKRSILNSMGLLHGIESDWNRALPLSLRQSHFACIDSLLNLKIARWVGII